MIPNDVIKQAQEFFYLGWTVTDVARMLTLSRMTARRIKEGKLIPDPKRKERQRLNQPYPRIRTTYYRRCITCGGLVTLPCVLCNVRELKAQDKERKHK